MQELEAFLAESSLVVNAKLKECVAKAKIEPERLRAAIRWSLFAGGKRFRPALMFAVGQEFDFASERLANVAAAVEMIHTYSLIHDDLPAMDDDDLRRGRETCHKKFGEATAILAGDTLQVLAFKAIADDETIRAKTRVELVSRLSEAAVRMVAGQQLDLEAEGREVSVAEVKRIHLNKTAALIEFAAVAPVLIAERPTAESAAIAKFATTLGLLFQITDDVLDVTQSTSVLGKTAAKDAAAAKATYPNVIGIEKSNELLEQIRDEAFESVAVLDAR
ncbi:MAG: polyprenyl synthetase family protein, partial [Acidobacteria bacterium]|nr:polyprenyl synthetase family protein [Acidobacteriota bacterium]